MNSHEERAKRRLRSRRSGAAGETAEQAFADVGLSNPADTGQLIGMLTPLIYAVPRSNVDEFNTP
jgi:hypothetical protein